MNREVVIVGGGLAGLLCGIVLARKGQDVLLLERSAYPRHKVCGEYISREVEPLLRDLDLFPDSEGPVWIDRLRLTTRSGKCLSSPLPLGAFSLSRYVLDRFLFQKAVESGVDVRTGQTVQSLKKTPHGYELTTREGLMVVGRHVVCSHGKRSQVDRELDRDFLRVRSLWVGVKYHIEWEMPDDLVELHHFPMGYCGLSRVEKGRVNLCYLVHAGQLRRAGTIDRMERKVLTENPFLAEVLQNGIRLWEKPLTISNVSFRPKKPVEKGIFFAGDSAGLISPLCGNGMAMALQAGYQLGVFLHAHLAGELDRKELEKQYACFWNREFGSRLWWGRRIQKLFWRPFLMDQLVGLGDRLPSLTRKIISFTHGKPVVPNTACLNGFHKEI
jgi:flavin-dependent dehydrogenase